MTDAQTTYHVTVFDLASLQLRRQGRRIDVLTADGQLLASTTVHPAASTRAAVYQALDQAVDARVARPAQVDGSTQLVSTQVGLYNPHTGMVALPEGRVAGSGQPVAVAEQGSSALLDEDALHLQVADSVRRLPVRSQDSRSVSREVSAHRQPLPAA